MSEFLLEYGMFLAKAVTVVAAVGAIVLMSVGASRKSHATGLTIEKLNDHYRDMARGLRRALLGRAEWRKQARLEKKQAKAQDKAARERPRQRVFVLDFKGDIKATAVASLREEISAVLTVARPEDEVVLRLENFGGVVHEHGLAASQLERIRERGIPITAIVDKVAASGGYLMACVANHIVAAPFAVVGSIGVLAQIPNFHRALDARGVDFEQITAGKYKRTVTMFGRTTDEERTKLREELEEVHALFKQVVGRHRPGLDIEAVSTGEHWYGTRAQELGLVDELGSSDDYLMKRAEVADLYHLSWRARPTLQQRVLSSIRALGDEFDLWVSQRQHESRFR